MKRSILCIMIAIGTLWSLRISTQVQSESLAAENVTVPDNNSTPIYRSEVIELAPVGGQPRFVDFDNDGDFDVVQAAAEARPAVTGTLEIYFNDNMQFTLHQSLPFPNTGAFDFTYLNGVSAVDFNQDGFLDFALVGGSQLSMYLNNAGMFAAEPAWQITLPGSIFPGGSFLWADVDRDGDDDLTIEINDILTIYENSSGLLTSMDSFPLAENSGDIERWADINEDGWLDLLTRTAQVYFNQSGSLDHEPGWRPVDYDLAYGDVFVEDFDRNGKLDILFATANTGARFYQNVDGVPPTVATYVIANEIQEVLDIGDFDGDGDFDLLAMPKFGVTGQFIHLNEDGVISPDRIAYGDGNDASPVQLADIDGNNSLDIVSLDLSTVYVFYGVQDGLQPGEPFDVEYGSCEVALGDVDGDSDLDIFFSRNNGGGGLYRNDDGQFSLIWEPVEAATEQITAARWVDVDADGDLDLSAVHIDDFVRIYLNQGGTLDPMASQTIPSQTHYLEWGDINGDGFLDLLIERDLPGVPFRPRVSILLNEAGTIADEPIWMFDASEIHLEPATFVDYDNDGDLDVSVSSFGITLFENVNGTIQATGIEIDEDEQSERLAWGDFDLDGDFDLVFSRVGNAPMAVRRTVNGQVGAEPWWESAPNGISAFPRRHDVDADGDPDLVERNAAFGSSISRPLMSIFPNERGQLLVNTPLGGDVLSNAATGFDFGDVDLDGVPDAILGMKCFNSEPNLIRRGERPALRGAGGTAGVRIAMPNAAHYHTSGEIHTGTIPISYTLYHPAGQAFRQVQGFYSLTGGGNWLPAVATSDTVTRNLTLDGTEATYLFNWDVDASGFYGKSDNVMFRIEALPAFASSPQLGGVNMPLAKVGANSHLLRVRGMQAQVVDDGEPVTGAIVLRLPEGETKAEPITDLGGKPFLTDQNGFLPGFGALAMGDQLLAMLPISATGSYTLYHTSGVPTPTGVAMHTISEGGVQVLEVSADSTNPEQAENPLMLLNLDISLEWDARNDIDYLTQLQSDIERTSEVLFDLTNGQAALGKVNVYQNRERWLESDIVVKVDNRHRPNANLGGIVEEPQNDTLRAGTIITNAVAPGQIRMGAIWNRYGEPTGTIGEDWPRVLAHEIGHYAFFQIDNYFGIDPETGLLVSADCQGSIMTDAYRQDYAEFLSREVENANGHQWDDSCATTLAEQTTGRSDWETIRSFYPFLSENIAQTGEGPASLPLDVTNIRVIAPANDMPIADDFFYLVDADGGALLLPDASAYRIVTNDPADDRDDEIIALGQPVGQLVQARGAMLGDRICVYDGTEQYGCVVVAAEDRLIPMHPIDDWNPQISVLPASPTTLAITVTQPTTAPLFVQFYPQSHPTRTLEAPIIELTSVGNDIHTGTIEFPITIFSGDLRLWSDSTPRREQISNFSYVPGWGGNNVYGWGGNNVYGWGGNNVYGWGGNNVYGWGANVGSVWFAPVASAEGQVTLLNVDNIFGELPGTILQRIGAVDTQSWLTPVGDAYRYITDREVADQIAIQFRYLERNLLIVTESELRVYYRPPNSDEWQRLDTILDDTLNLATAATVGDGDYAVMATIELPSFDVGWNSFGYPILENRPITTGLASLRGKFTSVYNDDDGEWHLYDTTVQPDFVPHVNTLHTLEFAQTYWVYATEPVTGYLGIPPRQANSQLPATYYGWLDGAATVGDVVMLESAEQSCANGTVIEVAGRPAYVLQAAATCADHVLRLTVNGTTISEAIRWDNRQAQFNKHDQLRLYLPLIVR